MTVTLLNMVVGRTRGTFKNGKIHYHHATVSFLLSLMKHVFFALFIICFLFFYFLLRHVQRSYVDTFIIFHIKTVFFSDVLKTFEEDIFIKSRTRELSLNQLSLFCIFVNQKFSNRKYLFKIYISDNLYNCA